MNQKKNSQESAVPLPLVMSKLGAPIVLTYFLLYVCIAVTVGGLVIFASFTEGVTWVTAHIYPQTTRAAKIALFYVVPACSALAFFRKGKQLSSVGFHISADVVAGSLWVLSFILSYSLAGAAWTVFGLLFGVGVIPVAIVAASLQAKWLTVGQILLRVTVVAVLHSISKRLNRRIISSKADTSSSD